MLRGERFDIERSSSNRLQSLSPQQPHQHWADQTHCVEAGVTLADFAFRLRLLDETAKQCDRLADDEVMIDFRQLGEVARFPNYHFRNSPHRDARRQIAYGCPKAYQLGAAVAERFALALVPTNSFAGALATVRARLVFWS